MPIKRNRPFYHEFAWSYDRIIDEDVACRSDFIVEQFETNGIRKGAKILDAGCGTGRYSVALAEQGYSVVGIDISDDLLIEAKRKRRSGLRGLDFQKMDILDLQLDGFDGLLCRGVLNDLISDDSRRKAIHSFSRVLRPKGVLILDVREWIETKARKSSEPNFTKIVNTEKGLLQFTSVTSLEDSRMLLRVKETHHLRTKKGHTGSEYEFVMRCWTIDELKELLISAGFVILGLLGDYNAAIRLGQTDRIVAIAQTL